jgi:hypothetical protein
MLSSHIGCGEDCDERRWRGSLFYTWTAICFFAFYQTYCPYHFEAELARGFDGLDG